MTVKTYSRLTLSFLVLVTGIVALVYFSKDLTAQASVAELAVTTDELAVELQPDPTEVIEETTESLEDTAEKSIEQVKKYLDADRVQGVLKNMFDNHHGIVGEVQRINDDALTIKNKQGTTILVIDDTTVLITKDKTAIKLNDIAVGNWVTLLGYKDGEDFDPKVVNVSSNSPRPDTQLVLLGMIKEITSKKVTILDRATGEERTFVFTKSSSVEDVSGEEVSISDFEEDVTVLISATTTDETEDFDVVTLRSVASLDDLR